MFGSVKTASDHPGVGMNQHDDGVSKHDEVSMMTPMTLQM